MTSENGCQWAEGLNSLLGLGKVVEFDIGD